MGEGGKIIFGYFRQILLKCSFYIVRARASLPTFCRTFIDPELKLEADITLDGLLSGL